VNTDPQEFLKFDAALRANAPSGFVPHYIAITTNGKNPDWLAISKRAGSMCSRCRLPWDKIPTKNEDGELKIIRRCPSCKTKPSNWKLPHARLNTGECVLRLERGDNVGLAALDRDVLVILDGDDEKSYAELKENGTLLDKSRDRKGGHAFFFDATPSRIFKRTLNTTEDIGEIRSDNAYVLVAGSYVPSNSSEPNSGKYTVERDVPAKSLTSVDQVPTIYRLEYEKASPVQNKVVNTRKFEPREGLLFNLTFDDVLPAIKFHTSHPEHGSDSGINFSISEDRLTCTCWRHNCSFGVVQFLAMSHGDFRCQEVGKIHRSNVKCSAPWNAMVLSAYLQAVKNGLLSANDCPIGAAFEIARLRKELKRKSEEEASS